MPYISRHVPGLSQIILTTNPKTPFQIHFLSFMNPCVFPGKDYPCFCFVSSYLILPFNKKNWCSPRSLNFSFIEGKDGHGLKQIQVWLGTQSHRLSPLQILPFFLIKKARLRVQGKQNYFNSKMDNTTVN